MADQDGAYPPNPKQTDDFPPKGNVAPPVAKDWHGGPSDPDNPSSGMLNQASPAAPKEALQNPAYPLNEPSPAPPAGFDASKFGKQPTGDDLFK